MRFEGGSDAGTPFNYHDGYALELELMQTMLGMSAREALHATTVAGADLLGLQRGTLGPGDTADLVLLAGNIDDDLRAFRDPVAVVKDGALAFERRHRTVEPAQLLMLEALGRNALGILSE